MHGSYNWTPTANYNEETLSIALDCELVTKFAKEFIELYNGIYFKKRRKSRVCGGLLWILKKNGYIILLIMYQNHF